MRSERYDLCARSITDIATLRLRERKNADTVLRWMVENREERIPQLLRDFDRIINRFNRNKPASLPEDLRNARNFKEQFPDRILPSLTRLAGEDIHNDNLIETFVIMNEMMIRGETTREEPNLSWLLGGGDEEAKFIGGLYHGYEERLLLDPEYAPWTTRGTIVDGLVEIASLEPDTSLWYRVADPEQLNWVENWEGFDPRFRARHGLE
ncbi:hypothetical protein HY469_02375 [Candidatus Roizmanbacteria bacterium]|nr:hypothetical protein [Candidatus Roizmanbacteria bacterium]